MREINKDQNKAILLKGHKDEEKPIKTTGESNKNLSSDKAPTNSDKAPTNSYKPSTTNNKKENTATFLGGGSQGKKGEEETYKAHEYTNAIADMIEKTGNLELANKIRRNNNDYLKSLEDAKNKAINSGITDAQKLFSQKAALNFGSNALNANEALSLDNALNNSVNNLITKSAYNANNLSKSVSNYGEMVGDLIQSPQVGKLIGEALKDKYNLGRRDYSFYEDAFNDLSNHLSQDNMGLLYDDTDFKKGNLLGNFYDDDNA